MVMFKLTTTMPENEINSNFSANLMFQPSKDTDDLMHVYWVETAFTFYVDIESINVQRKTGTETFFDEIRFDNGEPVSYIDDQGVEQTQTLRQAMKIDEYSTESHAISTQYMLDVASEYNILKQREMCENARPGYAKRKVLDHFRGMIGLLTSPSSVYQSLDIYLRFNAYMSDRALALYKGFFSGNFIKFLDIPEASMYVPNIADLSGEQQEHMIKDVNTRYAEYLQQSARDKKQLIDYIEENISKFDWEV